MFYKINDEVFSSQISRKKEFSELSKGVEPMTFQILDALSTKLRETRVERGHILGSYV